MKSYNGFSGELRAQAQRWLNTEIAAGRLTRPTSCVACDQKRGVIDMHAEDYSLPFAASKTDEFHLCFSCHMAVHCRFKNMAAWDSYRAAVGQGMQLVPLRGRDFTRFLQVFGMDFTKPSNGEIFVWAHPANLVTSPRPLDVIDGWLLANRGVGWR